MFLKEEKLQNNLIHWDMHIYIYVRIYIYREREMWISKC
jgi:hypothetical protein